MGSPQDESESCEDGEHATAWDSEAGESVCTNCGRSASEIVNELGHSLS